MTTFGYWLSSEEHAPADLVRNAVRAEEGPVLAAVREWEQAGFDQICLHQVGADQEGFLRFWKQELEPKLG